MHEMRYGWVTTSVVRAVVFHEGDAFFTWFEAGDVVWEFRGCVQPCLGIAVRAEHSADFGVFSFWFLLGFRVFVPCFCWVCHGAVSVSVFGMWGILWDMDSFLRWRQIVVVITSGLNCWNDRKLNDVVRARFYNTCKVFSDVYQRDPIFIFSKTHPWFLFFINLTNIRKWWGSSFRGALRD